MYEICYVEQLSVSLAGFHFLPNLVVECSASCFIFGSVWPGRRAGSPDLGFLALRAVPVQYLASDHGRVVPYF
jgi:hypothetical protein